MKQIPLSKGEFALVDDINFDRIIGMDRSWLCLSAPNRKSKYAYFMNAKRAIMMHNILYGRRPGEEVNHIDGNGLNNQMINLESVTHQVNILKHFGSKKSKNPLGRGVYICGSGRYVATIMWKCKRYHLGTFDTLVEARATFEKCYQEMTQEEYRKCDAL